MTDLASRTGLPDALRILLQDYPRDAWAANPRFEGLVRFWLDRHLMFRRMLAALRDDTQALLDGRIDPQAQAARLSRIGARLVGELEGHHQIEDGHYFPLLAAAEPRLVRGFDLLDADHHALDGVIGGFVQGANGLLSVWQDDAARPGAAGRFLTVLTDTDRLIDRHLVDEEDLIVPVILHHGPDGLG